MAADPDGVLALFEEPVLLDEWQEVPSVLGAVKRACDEGPKRTGRFILTGSIEAETATRTWPGVGRVIDVEMHPLTVGEQLSQPETPLIDRIAAGELDSMALRHAYERDLQVRDYLEFALRGGFPDSVYAPSDQSRRNWLDSYVRRIVTIDSEAADGNGGVDHVRLGRFFEACALGSASPISDTTLARAAGVTRHTASRYMTLLSRLHIVTELPGWTSNRIKRLSVAPKRFLVDGSLAAASTRATVATAMKDGSLMGSFLETLVVSQLRAQAAVSQHNSRLYHMRHRNGDREIDVIAELDARHLIAFEVKATGTPRSHHADHLAWLRDRVGDRFMAGVVLHTGILADQLGERLWALPISSLWRPFR